MSWTIIQWKTGKVKKTGGNITEGRRTNVTYYRRRDAGLCPLCGEPRTDEHIACRKCRINNSVMRNEYYRSYRAKQRAERTEQGLCVKCGKENDTQHTMCSSCLEEQRTASKRFRDRMKAEEG